MDNYDKQDGVKVIYVAGGCFWGLQKLMQSLPGVITAVCGYANGHSVAAPTYQQVCAGNTGYRETVRVDYDPEKISLDAILFAFFYVIDPAMQNRQGNDMGSQYQTGVYFTDSETEATVARIAAIQRERNRIFNVEIKPLISFYPAEEYHQNYLTKNPQGYCHIPAGEIALLRESKIDPGRYRRPETWQIKKMLSGEQYRVTQEAATEPPYENAYWNLLQPGIYVDVVTGEPLFSGEDKYASSCGWPAFSQPIDGAAMVYV
ncbi:MAG: peptide-methionine (S)-S-oxide reductase MsrA, partial [Clostridiales bacterium]